MVAAILNSPFGQAALRRLDAGTKARMTIHAKPATSPGGSFHMRVKNAGSVGSNGTVQHVVMVIDSHGRETRTDHLHVVTAYPTNKANDMFKFGPQIPRTRPGVGLYTANGRKRLYLWGGDD